MFSVVHLDQTVIVEEEPRYENLPVGTLWVPLVPALDHLDIEVRGGDFAGGSGQGGGTHHYLLGIFR